MNQNKKCKDCNEIIPNGFIYCGGFCCGSKPQKPLNWEEEFDKKFGCGDMEVKSDINL